MSNRPPRQLLIDRIAAALAQLYEQVQRCFQQATGGSDKLLLRGCLRDLLGLSRWSGNTDLHQQLVLLERLSRALYSDSRAARERVLLPMFRLLLRVNDAPRRQLAVCFWQRLDLLAATPVASVHEPRAEQADLLQILRGVRPFLPAAGRNALAVYVDAAAQPGLEQLLQQRLQALAAACGRSDWTLTDFVHSGMARQCRELTQLASYVGTYYVGTHYVGPRYVGAHFAGAHYGAALGQLEAQLLSLHVRGQRPAPAVLQQWLVYISSLALGKVPTEPAESVREAEPAESVEPVPAEKALAVITTQPQSAGSLVLDADTLDILRAELGCYIEHLRQELTALAPAGEQRVSARLLLVSGKLVWVLHAVGQLLLSELAQCLHQVYLQYWSLRLPLPADLLELSASFRHALARLQQEPRQQCCEAATVHALMSAVLVHWPSTSERPAQSVSLPSSDGKGWQTLLVSAVPGYLATACEGLLAAEAEWFTQLAQFPRRAAQLQQELRLLEQGMAAMKMPAVEEFCALLLDVYTHVRLPLPNAAVPGPLLWQARQQLILMLDRAAAGLDPLPDPGISNALTDWLTQADARLGQFVERQPSDPQWLQLKLAYFLRQTSKLLGRPLRLCLQQGQGACQLRPHQQQAVVAALFTLLRWTLLATEADMALRRKAHKPLAIALGIELALEGAGQCRVRLTDDSALVLPDQKQLARLQKTAGALVHSLGCTVQAEQLRCFSFLVELTS